MRLFISSRIFIGVACLFLGCGAQDNTVSQDMIPDPNNVAGNDSLVHDIIWQSANNDMENFQRSLEDMSTKLSTVLASLLEDGEAAKQRFLLQRTKRNGPSSQASRLLKRDADIMDASSMTRRSAGNVCLDPPDPLRTCFRRSIDPDNHYSCDFIDRKHYNMRREYGDLPYLAVDEHVFYGKLIISMLDNEHNVNTCDSRLRMEELLLTFLADNIGSPDTFTPICAYMTEYMFDSQEVPETDSQISGTAFHFDITFSQSSRVPNWRHLESNTDDDEEEEEEAHDTFVDRDLRRDKKKKNRATDKNGGKKKNKNGNNNGKKKNGSSGKKNNGSGKNARDKVKGKDKGKKNPSNENVFNCRASDQAMCCSQNAINGEAGAYCTKLGCNLSHCGSGRKALQPIDDALTSGGGSSWSGDNNSWSGRQRKLGQTDRAKSARKLTSWSKGTWYDNFNGQSTQSHDFKSYYCPAYGVLNSNDDGHFNVAVNELTPYNPSQTYAQLDVDFLVANDCSINRFSLNKYDLPTLVCTAFRDEECGHNNDLLPPVQYYYPVFCIDDSTNPPTMSPTVSPSESPTSSPSNSPTYLPTSTPSDLPTDFPTVHPSDYPTHSPSESPSSTPSSSPTDYPTKSPTQKPTKNPTASPTVPPPTTTPTFSPTEKPNS